MNPPQLTGSAPILLVTDVARAAEFYCDSLGFGFDRYWGDPPGFCILERDAHHLMLARLADDEPAHPHHKRINEMWDAYFWVNDARALYQEYSARKVAMVYELCDQPWGCREFAICDPDGYPLAFGQHLQPSE